MRLLLMFVLVRQRSLFALDALNRRHRRMT